MANEQPRRIGVLTSGGDAPGLNAVVRAVVKTATSLGWETLGIHEGFEGLLDEPNYEVLSSSEVRGLLPMGGTILRTTNSGHFTPKLIGRPHLTDDDPFVQAARNVQALGLLGLICIGGEGTQRIALELYRMGVPVVGVPKTIDNDLAGTDRTFGFDTALQVATDAIDRLHTTAASHNRVMVLEVMGRTAGWIAMHAGLAGGADAILVPEVPFDLSVIAKMIMEREARGSKFSIIVVAEGAKPAGGSEIYQAEGRLGGVGIMISDQLAKMTGKETRVVVLGHLQRGGSPTPYDRLLATRFGAAAVMAAARRGFGQMVSLHSSEITTVPLSEACSSVKTIPVHSDLFQTARGLGVSFGVDES